MTYDFIWLTPYTFTNLHSPPPASYLHKPNLNSEDVEVKILVVGGIGGKDKFAERDDFERVSTARQWDLVVAENKDTFWWRLRDLVHHTFNANILMYDDVNFAIFGVGIYCTNITYVTYLLIVEKKCLRILINIPQRNQSYKVKSAQSSLWYFHLIQN